MARTSIHSSSMYRLVPPGLCPGFSTIQGLPAMHIAFAQQEGHVLSSLSRSGAVNGIPRRLAAARAGVLSKRLPCAPEFGDQSLLRRDLGGGCIQEAQELADQQPVADLPLKDSVFDYCAGRDPPSHARAQRFCRGESRTRRLRQAEKAPSGGATIGQRPDGGARWRWCLRPRPRPSRCPVVPENTLA